MSFLGTRLDLLSTARQTQWRPCSCWQGGFGGKGTGEEDREGGREGGREGRGREGRGMTDTAILQTPYVYGLVKVNIGHNLVPRQEEESI